MTGIAFLVLVASIGTSFARTNFDRTITVDLNKYFDVPMLEVKAGETMNVEFQVTSGGAIDVLLMTPSDFENYKTAINQKGMTINYITEGSLKDSTNRKYTYKIKDAGDYHLVIDNTNLPKLGGVPMDQVEMNLKVSVTTQPASDSTSTGSESTPSSPGSTPPQPPKTPGFGAIVAAFVIVILVLRRK